MYGHKVQGKQHRARVIKCLKEAAVITHSARRPALSHQLPAWQVGSERIYDLALYFIYFICKNSKFRLCFHTKDNALHAAKYMSL